jgi:hypothetical protein
MSRRNPQPGWHAHAAPQGAVGAAGAASPRDDVPTVANTESTRRAPGWPAGQVAGADDSRIGCSCSKMSPQMAQRYS